MSAITDNKKEGFFETYNMFDEYAISKAYVDTPIYSIISSLLNEEHRLIIQKHKWNATKFQEDTTKSYICTKGGILDCLGFLLISLGVRKETLKGKTNFSPLWYCSGSDYDKQYYSAILKALQLTIQLPLKDTEETTGVAIHQLISDINDTTEMTLREKESFLKLIFSTFFNITLIFTE